MRTFGIICGACLLTACGSLEPRELSYNKSLEPVYIEKGASFADKGLIANVAMRLQSMGVKSSTESKNAKTIVQIKDTKRIARKIGATTSDSAYYKNEYSTTLSVSYNNTKHEGFEHNIAVNEKIAILENQNIFNNFYDSEELEKSLAERVVMDLLSSSFEKSV